METVLDVRIPEQRNERNLSKISKIFFGVDIFQVVVVVIFQSYMIAQGNFSKYDKKENPEGMGPGRRVYMGMYMGAIVYTCFLCLFAVKKKNFMEVLAFVLQNFGFATYSCIQVYHVGFKTNNLGLKTVLSRIALANAVVLFVLNIIFIYLAYKLYSEFGWKIYKKVRFDIKLRGVYTVYELLLCLLKMEILYYGMYAVCNSLVLLRDSRKALYYVSLSFIALSVLHVAVGLIATRREIRSLMLLFLLSTLGVIGYFLYKLYGFMKRTCSGCAEFMETGQDITSEAFLHFVYLASMNLVVMVLVFAVAVKAFMNFGVGLAKHFNPNARFGRTASGHPLSLRRTSNFEESVTYMSSYDSPFEEYKGTLSPSSSVLPLLAKATLQFMDKRSLSLPNLDNDPDQKPALPPNPSNGRIRPSGPGAHPLSKPLEISEDVERGNDRTECDASGKWNARERRISDSSTGEPDSRGLPNGSNSTKRHVNGNVQIHSYNGTISKETGCERTNNKQNSSRRGSNERIDSGIWGSPGNESSSVDNEQIDLCLPATSPNIGERSEAELPSV